MITDLRLALRRLRATPMVTLSAIACLAIGVWITCIVAAVARGFFTPELHIPAPARVVQLEERGLFSLDPMLCCRNGSSKSVHDSLARTRLFAAVGNYDERGAYVEGDPRYYHSAIFSSGMMEVLQVPPVLGRGFVASDDTTGIAAILSYQLWRSRYGGDSGVIGRRLLLRGESTPRIIVGVMPRDFMFPHRNPALYLSLRRRPDRLAFPQVRMLARLADGVDMSEARSVARGISARNVAANRDVYQAWWRHAIPGREHLSTAMPTSGVEVRLERYRDEPQDRRTTAFVLLISACGFAVVGIAASNVINLLLVRGSARRQEIAVRMALGASRERVVRELLIEAGVLSVCGVVLGFAIAMWQWTLLDAGLPTRYLLGDIDAGIAVVGLGAGMLLALVVGVWPGIRATSLSLEQVLRDSKRSGMGASSLDSILGRLVAGSTAATVMLLISAVLLGLSARSEAEGGVHLNERAFSTELTLDDRLSPGDRVSAAWAALARIREMPGVQAAALGGLPPYGTTRIVVIAPDGRPEMRSARVEVYSVSDDFFSTLSIPVLFGRAIDANDTGDNSGTVVVSRPLAEKMFPGRVAVGRRFRMHGVEDSSVVVATIVGVAEEVGVGHVASWQIYVPYASGAGSQVTVFAVPRSPSAELNLASIVRPLPGIIAAGPTRTVAELSRLMNPVPNYILNAFSLFAVVALVLATVGTYAVVAFSVERRTHEIGVRLALGADHRRIVRMILGQGLKLTLLGVLGGLVLSAITTKLLATFFQEVDAGYPLAIGAAVALVIFISLIASAIPGYRAGRMNAVDALRSE
jgi:putative ABC transport system permease protein